MTSQMQPGTGCATGMASSAIRLRLANGGKQREVVADALLATHSCPSSAVSSRHEMTDFTFHLWTGCPIVIEPLGILLAFAFLRQNSMESGSAAVVVGMLNSVLDSSSGSGTAVS